jgi:3',5'-cyclic AMP phosphodiesterase CpdA
VLIAQISDLHLTPPGHLLKGHVDTAAALRAIIAALNALTPPPDLVIASGDLVDAGDPDSYRHLRSLLDSLQPPCHLMPGNHDDRSNLLGEFAGSRYLPAAFDTATSRLDFACAGREGERVLCLDSLVTGQASGRLSPQSLDWLDRELRAYPTASLILLHHPPFPTGIAGMDAIGLQNPDDLAAILRAHPHVAGLSCGHVHRALFTRWQGMAACIAPGTAHQIALQWLADAPARYTLEPGAYLLHQLTPDQPLISYLAYPAGHPGPFDYSD